MDQDPKLNAAIARKLLGRAERGCASRYKLRYGDLSINLEKGTFYDSESDEGGTLVELICKRKNFTNGEYEPWLEALKSEEDARREAHKDPRRPLPSGTRLDLERKIIGWLLHLPDSHADIGERVGRKDFDFELHQDMFTAIGDLIADGIKFSPTRLIEELGGSDGGDVVPGFTLAEYIGRLIGDVYDLEPDVAMRWCSQLAATPKARADAPNKPKEDRTTYTPRSRSADEILSEQRIHLNSTAPGRHYALCPQCSHTRSARNKKSKVLGVTIDSQGIQWGCNHCDFHGGAYFDSKPYTVNNQFIATYDYVDEGGLLLFQVCRTADKNFPQRRPDGKGGWAWGSKDVRKVLYRLPELIEAIAEGQLVLVCEGEKDVDAAWRLGIAATCNPGGASEPGKKTKWLAEYSEMLRGADIVIVPDNDPPGHAHAGEIAAQSADIAHSIRVIDLAKHWTDCPKGGDLSDWLKAGGDRDKLDALIAAAEAPTAKQSAAGKTLIRTSAEFVAGFVPPEYVVVGLFQRRFFYSITGMTGAGKTAIMLLLAASAALGRDFAIRPTKQIRVLYLAAENADDIRMRWIALAQRMGFAVEEIQVFFVEGRFTLSKALDQLKKEALALGGEFGLVIVDTGPTFFEGKDENENKQLGDHAVMLRSLASYIPGGPAVLANCHPVKNATPDNLIPRGGGAFLNETDGNLTVAKNEMTTELHWQGKFRGPDFAPMQFLLETVTHQDLKDSDGRLIPTVVAQFITEKEKDERRALAQLDYRAALEYLKKHPKASESEVAGGLGWYFSGPERNPNKSRVHRAIGKLVAAKLIKRVEEAAGGGFEITKQGDAVLGGEQEAPQPGRRGRSKKIANEPKLALEEED